MGEVSGSPAGSAWAAAALFARVLASILAVAGPAVLGVPSAFRLDAPMTHEVLTTTRVAAAAHTLVVLVAHALSSARASSRPPPYARARAGLVVATARAVSALTMGTAVWFVAVACFGVSAAGKPLETAHLAALLASLTLVPGAVRHGAPLGGAAATTWGVLVTAARGVDDGAAPPPSSKKKKNNDCRTRAVSAPAPRVRTRGPGVGAGRLGRLPRGVVRRHGDPARLGQAVAEVAGAVRRRRRRRVRARGVRRRGDRLRLRADSSGDAEGEKTAEDRVNAQRLLDMYHRELECGRCRTCALPSVV
jgi:hypothetical protein